MWGPYQHTCINSFVGTTLSFSFILIYLHARTIWLADSWDAPPLIRLKDVFYLAKSTMFTVDILACDLVNQTLTICSISKELKAAECVALAR